MESYLNLAFALIVDSGVCALLKLIFRRPRPEHNTGNSGSARSELMLVYEAVHVDDMFGTISSTVDAYAFPSGHSTKSAVIATFLASKFT
jgi:membrane-associated phospholipid phosphatase